MRLNNAKDIAELRKKLLKEQKGIDPITKEKITAGVLDHSHLLGNCRQTLQREVNSFEGKVYNAYARYIRHLTKKSLPEILRNLADYLEKDYSHMPIHSTELSKDVKKYLRLSAKEQKDILIKYYESTEIDNAKKRAKAFRELLKTEKIDRLNG
jgi:hypothetical protein